VESIAPALVTLGGLIEPLPEPASSLASLGLASFKLRNRATDQGLIVSPLVSGDRSPGRQELRGLELLYQRERLSLPAGARLVVGREGEEMMKPAKIAKPPASTPNTPDARSPSLN
jgi:hypothetical protein